MVKEPKKWIEKQLARVRVSEGDYKAGIEAPERDPIKAALDANAKRVKKLQESITNKTWEKAMARVTMGDWQKKALDLGVRHFIEGVEANVDKITKFVEGFHPKLSAIQSSVKAMPEVTEAERDARVLAMIRGLRKLKGTV